MNHQQLRKLIGVVQASMDAANRSIAMANLRWILRKQKDVVFATAKARSVFVGNRRAERELRKGLQKWCYEWETRMKVLVVLRIDVVAPYERVYHGSSWKFDTMGKEIRRRVRLSVL